MTRLLIRFLRRLLIFALGRLQHLADRLRLPVRRRQGVVDSGPRRHLRNSGLRHPAARRAHGPENPSAQARAELHHHRRRIARRSRQSDADGHAATAPRGLCGRRLDGGRSARPSQLVGNGPRIRVQLALSRRAVQHPLPVRARPGHRLPEGDRRQPAQAPPHPVLGAEHRRARKRRSERQASGSTPTGRRRRRASTGSAPAPGTPASR